MICLFILYFNIYIYIYTVYNSIYIIYIQTNIRDPTRLERAAFPPPTKEALVGSPVQGPKPVEDVKV